MGDDVLEPEQAVAVGDTLAEAIKGALDILGAREDEVDVEILEEGRRGFLGLGRTRPYRVRVSWRDDDDETIEEEISPRERPRPERAPAAREPRRERPIEERIRRESRPDRPRGERASERGQPRGWREPSAERRPVSPRTATPPATPVEERRSRASYERARPLEPRPEPARREETPRRVEPAAPPVRSAPAISESADELRERARLAAEQLLQDMGMIATVSARNHDGDVWVDVVSDVDDALLIGRRGETRNALQYIVQRILGPRAESSGSVIVDVNGYWQRRMTRLAEEARATADRVAESGQEERTEPLTAQERRVVHRAVADDTRVRTESQGDGDVKRVSILPTNRS